MTEHIFVIRDELGLHARAAGQLAEMLSVYKSQVQVFYEDKMADGKDVLGLLSLDALFGGILRIQVVGDDEAAVVSALKNFFEK